MILVVRGLYIILVGYLFYKMIKNGGCCGGHSHNKNTELDKKRIIIENEKEKVIDMEKEN